MRADDDRPDGDGTETTKNEDVTDDAAEEENPLDEFVRGLAPGVDAPAPPEPRAPTAPRLGEGPPD